MKVLIVDDSSFAIATIRKVIEKMHGYEVVGEATNGKTAFQKVKKLEPDISTLDNILPDTIGTKLIEPFKKINPDVKIIMISAIQQSVVTQEALELGADDYLVKPFKDEELINTINAIRSGIHL